MLTESPISEDFVVAVSYSQRFGYLTAPIERLACSHQWCLSCL